MLETEIRMKGKPKKKYSLARVLLKRREYLKSGKMYKNKGEKIKGKKTTLKK